MIFDAFFDESGQSSDSRIVTVAGVIASRQVWDWFERAWRELLNAGSITKFHMTDFENRRGDFASWSDAFRREFISYVIQIFHRPPLFPFGVTMLMDDWLAMPQWRRDWFKDPYSIGVATVLQAASRGLPTIDTINFVFDRVPRLTGAATEAYNFVRNEKEYAPVIGSFEFASSEERLPLQAADFVAYEYGKFTRNRLFDSNRPTRWTMERLFEKPHAFFATQFSDVPSFERWL